MEGDDSAKVAEALVRPVFHRIDSPVPNSPSDDITACVCVGVGGGGGVEGRGELFKSVKISKIKMKEMRSTIFTADA